MERGETLGSQGLGGGQLGGGDRALLGGRRPLGGRSLLGGIAVAIAALALCVAPVSPAAARPENPSAQDRQIALAVRLLMERRHLSRHPIDDEMSARCLDAFIETLDPWKLYFYQSDVDEFSRNRDRLDELFRRGDISFAHQVFTRYLSRVEERVATATQLVGAEHDFTIDETMVSDRDATNYPATPEEAFERWRKRIKFDLLVQLADEVDLEEAREKIGKRYDSVRKRWNQTTSDELLELYLTAMTAGFDPHSSYMSPSTLENFNIQMKLELDGIGASLRSEDGYTVVHEIIAGGAADRGGDLKTGDKIIGVGQGTSGETEDIVDMRLNDVVQKIRGKRGTIVRLQVKPVDNPKETAEYTITRDRIELKNQEARSAMIDWGKKPNGQPYKVGVINLPSFYMDMEGARTNQPDYRSTTRDVRRLLQQFNANGVDAVVVDLRFNGGGSLTESVNMTGLFIDRGPVVQVKGPDGRVVPYNDDAPGLEWDGPLVVMTSRFSASASEIFAGAIQDYGRGIVIGDQSTHGKGTVQQLFDLSEAIFRIGNGPNLGALKMTIQQFYRPGGDSTQNRGVLADVTIPSITDHLEGITEAEMDYAMEFDRVRPLEHARLGMVDGQLAEALQVESDSRISKSKDFADDRRRINLYENQKERQEVTLNLEQYLVERAQLDEEKEKEEIGEKMGDSDRPAFDAEDHYNQEALSITVDYVRLLLENKVAVVR
ncbi:carboxy terminal-processing peptidase [Botrimarina hoheduenensis]|uniref:Tail-specific protease n=1 Tax=Botrimarina hoheduenensis TaxID=2528000 RepID=A0A5C5WCD3_9BACT|nr:carboxy terminal-processing peptidase [Botrimarina hoheduenensis]TWT48324.1 Tail-specific protease precursor [Botrimarina hoheduenensis]